MKYFINYGTGAGDESVEGALDDARKVAENNLCYTQKDVRIEDENGNIVARLPWWGVVPEEDDEVVCRFGDSGFYGAWQEDV